MLLNALWRVPEDLRIHNLADRTITIDTTNGVYGDANIWGKIEDYTNTEAQAASLLREIDKNQVCLTALLDKPLKVEIWDSVNDDSFSLDWDGIGWSRGDSLPVEDESFDGWTALTVVDVEQLVFSACKDLGFGYLEPSSLRNGSYQIELIERENFGMLSMYGSHIFYHSLDDVNFQYTTDQSLVPSVSEFNAIQCMEEGNTHNTVYVLYDEEDGPMASLNRIFKRNDISVTTYENDTDDIVDMRWLASKAIENDSLVSHLYLIYHNGESGRKYRLFINMEQFQPKYAPYLATNY